MVAKRGSVDPAKHPDEKFDLFSVPAFDAGAPEVARGAAIGSQKQIVQPGDVLLCRIVPHIRRAWVVGPNNGRRQIASGEWIVFQSDRAEPRYLRHLLVSDRFHGQFMNTVAGVGGSLLRARPEFVKKIRVPLPPLEEQRRIADVLDRAEELRAKRGAAIEKLATVKQSIFLDMFGDPKANPKEWGESRLGDVSIQITDGEHVTPPRSKFGIKLLSARNVRDGYLDVSETDFVDQAVYEKLRKRCDPNPGDLLISCSGTIGRVARVTTNEPLALVRSVAFVRPNDTVLDSIFLEYQLRTPALQRQMKRAAKASSQANLFQGPVRQLSVVVPPIELQAEFAARIEAAEQVGGQQEQSEWNIEEARLSIQARAFAGTL